MPHQYYFRRESPTQTLQLARKVATDRELRGKTNRFSVLPSVDAFVGPLPDGEFGMEFATDVPPDPGSPPGRARWTGPRPGVRSFTDADGVDWVAIPVTVTKIRAREDRR